MASTNTLVFRYSPIHHQRYFKKAP